MNSVLQCLSNTKPLLEYFLRDDFTFDKNTTTSSMKGQLVTGMFRNHPLPLSSKIGERFRNIKDNNSIFKIDNQCGFGPQEIIFKKSVNM